MELAVRDMMEADSYEDFIEARTEINTLSFVLEIPSRLLIDLATTDELIEEEEEDA